MIDYCKKFITRIRICGMSDISHRRQIILLVLRILAAIGIIIFFVMWLSSDRSYMTWFFSGLAIVCFVVPELTAELLIRDFPSPGIRKISHRIRLALTPVIYGLFYAVSPLLFHSFFKLFAEGNRTTDGNTSSLQIGLWHVFFGPQSYGPSIALIMIITFSVLLLTVSAAICYLISSASWRRRLTALILFIVFEAAAALAAGNSPG